jgi:hypothetical protein
MKERSAKRVHQQWVDTRHRWFSATFEQRRRHQTELVGKALELPPVQLGAVPRLIAHVPGTATRQLEVLADGSIPEVIGARL